MTRFERKGTDPGIHDPNLTPLIDVSLVLVVILLVATPMALQSGIAVSHASASGKAGPTTPVARTEITVLDDTRVQVNRVVVTRQDLAATLAPLLKSSSTGEVVVRCEGENVSHGAFVSVLDEAKHCGAVRIAVVGR
jgi:biopolymer transport protein ExbD